MSAFDQWSATETERFEDDIEQQLQILSHGIGRWLTEDEKDGLINVAVDQAEEGRTPNIASVFFEDSPEEFCNWMSRACGTEKGR